MAGMVSVEVRPPRTPTTGTKFHLPPHETQRPDPALTESAHPAMQRESAGPLTFAKPVSWQLGKQLTSFHLAITKKRRNAQGMARAARHDPTYRVGRLRLEAEDQRARNGVSPNNKTARLTLSDKVVCRSDPAPALPARVRAGSLCFWPSPSFPHGEFGPGLSSFEKTNQAAADHEPIPFRRSSADETDPPRSRGNNPLLARSQVEGGRVWGRIFSTTPVFFLLEGGIFSATNKHDGPQLLSLFLWQFFFLHVVFYSFLSF
ncbi:hypothetical protein AGDE_17068 [Angomonas deanei]|nr:hypothetical protein AGDE_17068 [Angomonas deanei]|eukprot:EPY15561.1 hypothetical protein AGDE_17068 [Angomonas deanei]